MYHKIFHDNQRYTLVNLAYITSLYVDSTGIGWLSTVSTGADEQISVPVDQVPALLDAIDEYNHYQLTLAGQL